MTWGSENDKAKQKDRLLEDMKLPRNGCRGLFYAALFSLAIVAVVLIIILIIRC